MDSWAHNEATDVTKVTNIHYEKWDKLLEEGGRAHQS